jgi:hypothetical protein
MKKKQEEIKHLDQTIDFVKKGFIKGLWANRKADIDHIFKGFSELKNKIEHEN